MTLLAPMAALAAGAIGGTLLVAMYMLRLRRRPVRVSSTLFWGDPARDLEANVPLRMVRPAWTLALQALALALLALALGRPAIDAEGSASGRVYIVIDRSASMNARDGSGGVSRLEAARAEALEIVRTIGGIGGSRAMVVVFSARAEIASAMTADRAALEAAIRAIEPTDEAGDVDAALDLVGAMIAGEAAEDSAAPGARVVLLSDGHTSGPVVRPLAGAAVEFRPMAPPAPPQGRDNLAIATLATQREPDDPARVRTFVRLLSVRAEPTAAMVILTIDGQELARRAVSIPAATWDESTSAGSEPEPGEASLSLEFVRAEGGVLRAAIDRADILAADNEAAVVQQPVRRPRLLLVCQDQPDYFLLEVLEELRPAWLRVFSASAMATPAWADAEAQADLIIFDRATPPSTPARPTLSFGAGLPAPGPSATPHEEPRPTGAVRWDRAHPALADVTLDALVVSRPLRLPEGGVVQARTLASGRDGPLIVETRDGPARRIVVGFALSDSNWPMTVGFPIFLSNAVDHLAYGGEPGRGRWFPAGEPIMLDDVPSPGPGTMLRAIDDRGGTVASGVGSVVIPRAGVYRIAGAPGADRHVAVNLGDEFESRIGASAEFRIAGETVAGVAGVRRPRELWFWFVLLAGVVLAVEWAVYVAGARS